MVNPWNISELAASIGYALNMPADEREKRHHHNFMHVTTHTSQEWAETFIRYMNFILYVQHHENYGLFVCSSYEHLF